MLKFMKKRKKKLNEEDEREGWEWTPKKRIVQKLNDLTREERRALLRSVEKWLDALMTQRTLYEAIGSDQPKPNAPQDVVNMTVNSLLWELNAMLCDYYREANVEWNKKGIFIYFPSGKVFRICAEKVKKSPRKIPSPTW